jgi:hypothetical protein
MGSLGAALNVHCHKVVAGRDGTAALCTAVGRRVILDGAIWIVQALFAWTAMVAHRAYPDKPIVVISTFDSLAAVATHFGRNGPRTIA